MIVCDDCMCDKCDIIPYVDDMYEINIGGIVGIAITLVVIGCIISCAVMSIVIYCKFYKKKFAEVH